MTIPDFLTFLTRLFYLLAALVSLIDFMRQRDRMRGDIALLFGSLALVIFVQIIRPSLAQNPLLPVLSIISSGLTMSMGYFLLRIVQHFWAVPRWIIVIAIVGLGLSWLVFFIYPTPPIPTFITIGLVAYLVFLIGYEAWAFIRGAIRTKGVTQGRLILVAAGTGMLTLLFVLAGVTSAFPSFREPLQIISGLSGTLSGLFYYLGFAPPRWLRRFWQLRELYQFFQSSIDEVEEDPRRLMARLGDFAVRSVGGMTAITGLWDASSAKLIFQNGNARYSELDGMLDESNLTAKAWDERKGRFLRCNASMGAGEFALARALDSRSVFAVPISKGEHPLGLLLVFMRYSSLFPDDDLDVLRLLAEQNAIELEYARLLEEQRMLVQELHRRSGQLEQANRELEAFAYTVSHDLRAPLRAVDGFAHILDDDYRGLLPDEGQETLDFILQNSKQMGQMIDDLLMFSRLGRAEIVRETVRMKELVEEIAADQKRSMNGRSVTINVGDLPNAQANRNLLKQVLTNLLSNALKFSRARDHAEIEIGSQAGDDGQTIYYVRDNGVGFDMAYYNKLFGVFERLQNPEDYEGTGVGLAIVQRIIDRHGGRVWAESEPNKGATFYFVVGEAETI